MRNDRAVWLDVVIVGAFMLATVAPDLISLIGWLAS